MANILQMKEQERIASLAALGWSIRRIARELRLHRKTVRAYFPRAEDAAKCTTPVTAGNGPKCTTLTAGKTGAFSTCAPHAETIRAKFASGLTAQRIFQDLRAEAGFGGSYESVKRFVRALRLAAPPERVHRVEVAPGEEAQVDFGAGAPLVEPDQRKRRTWVFRIVLSYSRKGYSEAVLRQTTETFLRCLENAFRHFGGVPRTLNLDNLKAAVLKSDWADPDLNPKLAEFARHYGVVILPCKPRTPEHKGKVESSVGYVKGNALAGRLFPSLAAQNAHLARWEAATADLRIHGTTKRQVAQLFAAERSALQPLPPTLFPCFQEGERTVHRDAFVEVEKAYYTAPAEYIGRTIWARWTEREVRLYNGRWEQIQVHARLQPGQFSKALGIGGGAGRLDENLRYWQERASALGASCAEWARGLVQRRGIEAMRSLMALARLAEKHSFRAVNQACARAAARDLWRFKDVRALLDSRETQTQMAFLEDHPLIRNLSEYGIFIRAQNQNQKEHP